MVADLSWLPAIATPRSMKDTLNIAPTVISKKNAGFGAITNFDQKMLAMTASGCFR
jgi:hypothetical protein